MHETPILVLSEAAIGDVDKIKKFIADQESPHLVIHSAEVQQKAAEQGLLLMIKTSEDDIAGTAIVIPLGNQPYSEFGNIAVKKEWQGFQFQQQLTRVAAASIIPIAGFDERLISGVDSSNGPSKHNLTKSGFAPVTFSLAEFFVACSGCPKKNSLPKDKPCCCEFLLLSEEAQRALISEIVGLARETIIANTTTGKKVVLRFECQCVINNYYQQMLIDFLRSGS